MEPVDRHPLEADVSFDGGDLDCGNGLLLLIRRHIDPLERGQLLEFRSTEISVEEDFPAWCRMTGNDLISLVRRGKERSFLVCKGKLGERRSPTRRARMATLAPPSRRLVEVTVPRPRWMLQAIHEHLEGRLGEAEFEATGDDAVRLAVDAQLRAGADVITDGEQRRDNYASFVGGRLDNCQLIPLTDLRPLVVPASEVRHPTLFGPLGRSRPLAGHEHAFVHGLTDKPVKIALPGPY